MSHTIIGGPLQIETAHGAPVEIYGRTLTPVARIISGGQHEGTVREAGFAGHGWAFVHVKPLALIEERAGEVRRIPIPDATGKTLRNMALLSVVVAVASMVFILVGRAKRA